MTYHWAACDLLCIRGTASINMFLIYLTLCWCQSWTTFGHSYDITSWQMFAQVNIIIEFWTKYSCFKIPDGFEFDEFYNLHDFAQGSLGLLKPDLILKKSYHTFKNIPKFINLETQK